MLEPVILLTTSLTLSIVGGIRRGVCVGGAVWGKKRIAKVDELEGKFMYLP